MVDDWHPSPDFRRRAALWGMALPEPEFTPAELAAFRDYWAAEGKVFTQVQWEQKFARHVNHVRAQVKPVSKGVNHAAAPVAPHHGQFRKFGQHVSSGNVKTDLSATETVWKLWELMGRFIRTAGPRRTGPHLRSSGLHRLAR